MTTLLQSHSTARESAEETLRRIQGRLRQDGHEELLPLVEELSESDFGLKLMRLGGLDWALTDSLFADLPGEPKAELIERSGIDQKIIQCPLVQATRERFTIFRSILVNTWKFGQKIADLPCGRMRSLLTAPGRPDETLLVGLDKDPEATKAAMRFAEELGVDRVSFFQRDALKLSDVPGFDMILSNGLTIYLDDSSVRAFYAEMRKALQEGGTLVVSSLTPPDEWDMDAIDLDLLRFEHVLLQQVVQARWLPHLRSESTCRSQITAAGFKVEDVCYDRARRFPTYLCRAV